MILIVDDHKPDDADVFYLRPYHSGDGGRDVRLGINSGSRPDYSAFPRLPYKRT
jgi:hypothetical protein